MLIRENLQLKANARDEELILSAYEKWGEDCVKHLTGDFAFAIWDERSQRLFCARDHFGVKPFFYTYINGNFNFSSTLNDLRPGVSNRLNEIAIGDYLLFGVNQDNSTTIFQDIQRLPPGHTLTLANNEITSNGGTALKTITLPTSLSVNQTCLPSGVAAMSGQNGISCFTRPTICLPPR